VQPRSKGFPCIGAALLALVPCACVPPARGGERLPRVVSASFPVVLAGTGGELRVPAAPRRILPGNAAWVDFVTLLVPPERVVALPGEAFGYSRLTQDPRPWSGVPRLASFEGERILALEPDLVLAHTWQNPETLAGLRRAGVPVLVLPVPESWEEIVDTLELLGVALGAGAEAGAAVDALGERRARLAARAAPLRGTRVLSYTNLGAGGWTSGRRTTAQILLDLAGLENAAAEAGSVGDFPADAERVLALAPDAFLVGSPDASESSPPSATFLLGDPALAELPAIRARRIVTLAPALFTSASPELLSGAEALVSALEAGASTR
jgi:iron complex transport system substrate-binding protein